VRVLGSVRSRRSGFKVAGEQLFGSLGTTFRIGADVPSSSEPSSIYPELT